MKLIFQWELQWDVFLDKIYTVRVAVYIHGF